jgi:nicotinamidase-related amidase
MLNDFIKQKGSPVYANQLKKIIPSVERMIEQAHRVGLPVFFVCDNHKSTSGVCVVKWRRHAMNGTPGANVIDELDGSADDTQIFKTTKQWLSN